ncbi:uncharacterized protein LOC123875809 [Maniola jurtina]|uniref:uncharacterized protein LOC123875809 n=1 Tax=Maniola jurtina TaxID=191418 RepID=UPI001E68A2EC|nr:uncharacterized protein LOC123875809 [Maniola jurtina]
MEEEIDDLKSVLRSLVVSSPTRMDARSLLRDYRNMVGTHLPTAKFGFRDPIAFLRERFSDCFLFQGPSANPELTLIVTENLKHVDEHVQRQKVSATNKYKVKRRSVSAATVRPSQGLIADTFSNGWSRTKRLVTSSRQNGEYTDSTDSSTDNHATIKHNGEPSTHRQVNSQEQPRDRRDSFRDDDSGRLTASSSSSGGKRAQLEELKKEVLDLVLEHSSGLMCTELMKVYSERHGRELNFTRFGYTSILSLAGSVRGVTVTADGARGDWLLSDAARAPPPRPPPPRVLPRAPARPSLPADPEEALPGIPYAPDVFPEDCMGLADSIPAASLAGLAVGDELEVAVGEVYSPSHFWLQRLGDEHNIAMENMMDDMNRYYERGEGKHRRLSAAAVRVGFYCTSRYDGDWHRSLIVRILDVDTVKVRHVDYGTVERCAVSALRPLRREWSALPAQAIRGRLANVRPVAGGRRWPLATSLHFLNLIQWKPLIARVKALDSQTDMLEVILIDTSTEDDCCIATQLITAEHADRRTDPALGTSECYLYPHFEALESGATPNFEEVNAYVRDGIELDFVDDYRNHVPPCLPPADEQSAAPAADAAQQTAAPAADAAQQTAAPAADAAQQTAAPAACAGDILALQLPVPELHRAQASYSPTAAILPIDGMWLTGTDLCCYLTLHRQNPDWGHYFLMSAMTRAWNVSRLNPNAHDFRLTPPGYTDNNSTS